MIPRLSALGLIGAVFAAAVATAGLVWAARSEPPSLGPSVVVSGPPGPVGDPTAAPTGPPSARPTPSGPPSAPAGPVRPPPPREGGDDDDGGDDGGDDGDDD
ncbi:hypothetical protein DPM19_20200 [Actinomadura craniellae]|uniref:Small hydrophilic protein n=1 Tax=Actinomadura craniellae TaxID=2231787 RepID=A0A365H2R4_9ACTN|nr:hypothetical protein [Actinomadura craniellae]RAY13394.1 hypothetical protein DPM19_20200 [Actinomadura craniellae]